MSLEEQLIEEQYELAREMWAADATLQDIAEQLNCSIYALTWWLPWETVCQRCGHILRVHHGPGACRDEACDCSSFISPPGK